MTSRPAAPQPLPLGDAPLRGSRVLANGVLLDGGRRALLPLVNGPDARAPLWVRDALGRRTEARLERRAEALGLVLVSLAVPLPAPRLEITGHDPFAGSPGHVVAFAESADAAPAWPWLYEGFVGSHVAGSKSLRRLGIDVAVPALGAPLFDASGRWAGIVLEGADGKPAWQPMEALRAVLGDAVAAAGGAGSGPGALRPRLAPDEIYERSMRVVLQVIGIPAR